MPNGNGPLRSFLDCVVFTAGLMCFALRFQVSPPLSFAYRKHHVWSQFSNSGKVLKWPCKMARQIPLMIWASGNWMHSVSCYLIIPPAQHLWTTSAAGGRCIKGSKSQSTMDNHQKRNLTFLTIGLIFMLSGIEYGKFIMTALRTWRHEIMVSLEQNLPGISAVSTHHRGYLIEIFCCG